MDSQYVFFARQLMFQLPFLLASLLGVILALVFWTRGRGVAVLVLITSLFLAFVSLFVSVTQTYLPFARLNRGWPATTYGFWTSAVALTSTTLRALAFVTLIVAVFIGRKKQ